MPVVSRLTISIILPSRNRAVSLARAVASLIEKADDHSRIEVLIGIDEDARQTSLPPVLTEHATIRPIVRPRPDTVAEVANQLAVEARGSLLVYSGDDIAVETPGWDSILASSHAAQAPYPYAASFIDPIHREVPTYWIMDRSFYSALGFFCAPWFPYWFADTWVYEVGMLSRRLFELPVRLSYPDGRGETIGMYDLPWWIDFFVNTRPVRLRQAEAILSSCGGASRQIAQSCWPMIMPQLDRYIEWLRGWALRLGANSASEPSERYLRAKAAAELFLVSLR